MIHTIIFDGEGVVIDSEEIWDRGQEEFLRRRGIKYDRERVKTRLAGRSMIEGARILQEEYGFDGDPKALAQERVEIVRNLFATETQFMPGFEEFFERVRERYRTAIATVMSPVLLEAVIDRLNLRRYFGEHIYSLESGSLPSKPQPDLFLFTAKMLGSGPEECMVIEDSPNGIEAARRAGMRCIGIATTFRPEQIQAADVVVRSFDEIDLNAPALN